MREDARIVRQPIYGLLFGNVLLFALAFVMRHHTLIALTPGRAADFVFLDEMGALMVWGTAVLFFDCILIILVYEHARRWLGAHTFVRLTVAGVVVLTFDQIAFYAGLHMLTGAGVRVLIGGWFAKMGAVALYSVLTGLYLRYFEPPFGHTVAPRLADVFDTLTYRERYEDLLARTGYDALTGALDRGYLETRGRHVIDQAARDGRAVSLILVDIDHFKDFNDHFGHAVGDEALKRLYRDIAAAVRTSDLVFRFGGEEFVIIAEGLNAEQALVLGERIRDSIAGHVDPATVRITASIGIASLGADVADYDTMFATADQRLYQAKASGRNCVVGEQTPSAAPAAMRLVQTGH
jgi:diguanylate cyclase (GGDEF)-like protein